MEEIKGASSVDIWDINEDIGLGGLDSLAALWCAIRGIDLK